MKGSRFLAAGAVLVAAVAAAAAGSGCGNVNVIHWLRSRDQINKGINAFKSAAYPQAVEHFKEAVRLDPTLINARLYLATAYMSQYVPGAESEENLRHAEAATNGFLDALKQEPNSELAIESLGSICFNQKKLDDAKKWYSKLIEINNKKKEAYYTIGVINWTKSYQPRMEVRAKIGMKPEEPGPIKDKKARAELRTQTETVIKEGLDMLERALAIDPNYDDAMAYVNLLYREQADLVDTAEENKALTDKADDWVQKSMEIKKKKLEAPAPPKSS